MANILITDDAMFMRTMLKSILTGAGHNIIAEASNGKEAVELYAKYKPDLVTMDITMPELDGIGALKEIMKSDPQANVIMVTAMGQQVMVVEAVKAGAKDFIVKPFNSDKVLESVNKLIK